MSSPEWLLLIDVQSRTPSMSSSLPAPPLLQPIAPSDDDIKAFLDAHTELLQLERDAEEEQTRLLNSKCSPKELERKGLSLGGLGVSAINVGLGGKT